MSIETSHLVRLVLWLTVMAAAVIVLADDEADPVVEYYWEKARTTFEANNPATANLQYTLTARTYYKHISRRGKMVKIDSAVVDYYCTGNEVDSLKMVSGDNSRFPNLDLTFTNILNMAYRHYTFPNDTGGIDLALGFDADSGSNNPDGLIIIDRNRYLLRWLYLYYPAKPGYRRFTRSFRFTQVDSYVFPDSIWEVATRPGIFTDDSYRLETGVTDIKIRTDNRRSN